MDNGMDQGIEVEVQDNLSESKEGNKPKTLRSARKLEKSTRKPKEAQEMKKKVTKAPVENSEEPKSSERTEKIKGKEPRSSLKLQLSATLIRKLKQKAQVEGISVDEFACELLAEGLTLRAWEIMEGKSAMRSPSFSQQQNGNGGYRNQKGFRGNNNFQKRGQGYWNQNQNQGNWQDNGPSNMNRDPLDDQAAFFEFVRNQEKNQR